MTVLAHEKPIHDAEETLRQLRKQDFLSPKELSEMEQKLEQLRQKTYRELKAWDRVAISRHPQRPHALDFIRALADEFVELHGDRTFRDDRAVIGGLARIGDCKCVILGQEKGNDTDSRLAHNFGMPHPEGYRKALRLMEMAEKFNLPVVALLDTPGAYPGLAAEERGQGWAIARNLLEMARLRTPIAILVIGEGCSGGALGMGVGDVIGMLQHAYYSVISPEGCASILWKEAGKNGTAAEILKMQAEDLLALGLIDHILPEPLGGAHHNPTAVFATAKTFLVEQLELLKGLPLDLLLEKRYQKFRKMGTVVG